jgi:hypothetical protein
MLFAVSLQDPFVSVGVTAGAAADCHGGTGSARSGERAGVVVTVQVDT